MLHLDFTNYDVWIINLWNFNRMFWISNAIPFFWLNWITQGIMVFWNITNGIEDLSTKFVQMMILG